MKTSGKHNVSPAGAALHEPTKRPYCNPVYLAFILILFILWTIWTIEVHYSSARHNIKHDIDEHDFCPQALSLLPCNPLLDKLGDNYTSTSFRTRAADWLSKAVQHKTESYDHMNPPGVDSRFQAFLPFQEYLFSAFPEVNKTLDITRVNLFGLVYVWNGSDPDLKPILLTAHQDVVPVSNETRNQWKHDPYSGDIDDEFVWGRGSVDDKGILISLMASIETLLEASFKPRRTIVLAFGFDEESGGIYGAFELEKHLRDQYGKNGFAMLIDEGLGYGRQYGQVFAFAGVAEKGFFNVQISVTSPGGHSSTPPEHTNIGMLASMLVRYEGHPFEAHLNRSTPVYETVQCLGKYGPDLSDDLKKLIRQSVSSDEALDEVEKMIFKDKFVRNLVTTTQAMTVVGGGVKSNALPEEAWAVINHRVASDYSLEELKERQIELLTPLAERFKLSLNAFGEEIPLSQDGPKIGNLTLIDYSVAIDATPYAPSGQVDVAYRVFSGSVKAAYAAGHEGPDVVVTPVVIPFNTDTRHYFNLTKNIYRYSHVDLDSGSLDNIHTVNEKMSIKSLVEMVRFTTTLILNADESRDL